MAKLSREGEILFICPATGTTSRWAMDLYEGLFLNRVPCAATHIHKGRIFGANYFKWGLQILISPPKTLAWVCKKEDLVLIFIGKGDFSGGFLR